jgi:acetyl esterase/lipase
LANGYFLDKATLDWMIKHYCPPGVELTDPRLSPLRARDLSGQPPTLVHTAEFDPLRDEGRAYADRLQQACVEVRYTCHAGMIHHFYGMAGVIPYAHVAMNALGSDISTAFGHKADAAPIAADH